MQYNQDKRYPILFENRSECCGCGVCALICPLNAASQIGAIKMESDEEGFLYPVIDKVRCIKCYKCVLICPLKNDKLNAKKTY